MRAPRDDSEDGTEEPPGETVPPGEIGRFIHLARSRGLIDEATAHALLALQAQPQEAASPSRPTLAERARQARALFVYQALFVMFGALLARRSRLAGQFLAGIGVCLVPLAFVAAANLLAVSRGLGGVAAAALALGCGVSLMAAGRRLEDDGDA